MSCNSLKQMARIVADRTHVAVIEDLRKRALHDFAVLQNVGDAGRTSQVVFKNVILAVAVSNEIRSGDVAPRSLAAVSIRCKPCGMISPKESDPTE